MGGSHHDHSGSAFRSSIRLNIVLTALHLSIRFEFGSQSLFGAAPPDLV